MKRSEFMNFRGDSKTRRCRFSGRAPVLLLFLFLGAGLVRADTIVMVSGDAYKDVIVTSATWENVGFKRGKDGAPQSVRGTDVLSLERSSPRLDPLRKAIGEGEFKDAERRVDDAIEFGRPWEQAEAAYLKGSLYLAWSGRDPTRARTAIQALESYLEAYSSKKDFFIPEATFDLGSAYLAAKQYAPAEKYFRDLEKFSGGNGSRRKGSGKWGYKLKIGLGRTLMESGQKLVEARRYFDAVSRDRKAPTKIQRDATVLRARVQVMQGQHGEVIREMGAFVSRDPVYDEANALAMVVLGDAHLARKGVANQHQAEIWYLKTTLFGKRYQAVYREAAEKLAGVYGALGNAERSREWKAKVK